ncbi:MAG: NAD-dependent epimerase/dehydratase family protein, partial [Gemmatimonadetes bacterium]|nr:NAD-dependent epimerase/dehydratase family protein [Gemmatimonadota bacterium]
EVVRIDGEPVDEVFQLAADMGGMGFIHAHECEIMTNSSLINTHMASAAAEAEVGRYFFSSSACVYRDQPLGDTYLVEDDVYPALPDNEYGWEKLYAERLALAFGRETGMAVRIARFQNCYGPLGTWQGGREKAPAALSRKVAMADDGGEIEVWGDGSASRTYIFVEDLCRGVLSLMDSSVEDPVNIGTDELVSVDELAQAVIATSGKKLVVRHVDGPVGVMARYHSTERIRSTGWEPRVTFEEGIRRTYGWVAEQVNAGATAAANLEE